MISAIVISFIIGNILTPRISSEKVLSLIFMHIQSAPDTMGSGGYNYSGCDKITSFDSIPETSMGHNKEFNLKSDSVFTIISGGIDLFKGDFYGSEKSKARICQKF